MKPFVAAAVATALSLAAAPSGAATRYTLTDLGMLAGDSASDAYGLNDAGQVVGASWGEAGSRGFFWSNGTTTDVGALPGDFQVQANGINNAGQVVGLSASADLHAYVWSAGTMTELAAPNGYAGGALSINDAGQVAGTVYDDVGGAAVLWTNGVPTLLATLPGQTESYARGINAAGLVAGESVTATGSRAVLLSAGSAVDLGTLAGFEGAYATGLNNAGAVVGVSYYFGGDNTHATLWSAGTITDLGALMAGAYSYAFGINDAGAVVGQSGLLGAFLYDGGQLADLDTLVDNLGGWSLDVAYAINASGQIVGTGTIDGVSRAFLLTPQAITDPVPEPGEWAMITTGLLIVGALAQRRRALD